MNAFKGRRKTAHVGRRAHDDRIGLIQYIPPRGRFLSLDQTDDGAFDRRRSLGDRFGDLDGVPVSAVVDYDDFDWD
jgi:hypothetical protein